MSGSEGSAGTNSSEDCHSCVGTSGSEGTSEGGGDADASLELPPGASVNTGRVATAHTCVECHSNTDGAEAMRDDQGRAIAAHDLWRGTMMANSARDPFWHAMVEAEVLATPSAAAAIEAKCTRCHAPLLAAELELRGEDPPAMATLLEPDSELAALGLDGVSCTLCHQIEADKLGQPASFSGAWLVAGEGRIYGPHADPFEMPMLHHVEMTPTQGDQLRDAALCATCHTLDTDALRADGTALGQSLPEQTPYLEWQNSSFSTSSCQGCHVPTSSVDGVPISTKIARRPMGDDFPPISPRSPFGRHLFVGGNTMMLGLIRDQAAALEPDAPSAAFDATLAATREQLEQRTASLSFGEITRAGDSLQIPVSIASVVGHKLPTGFPSRRVFLRVEVRDGGGALVFESGGFDDRGRLVDGAGEVLPEELAGGPTMAHADEIASPELVQIWEAIMADEHGDPTYRLLRGADYLKDNRLLPPGWDPAAASDAIAPHGVDGDADFESAGDTLTYLVSAPADAGPYAITVEAYYQAISPRFAAELFALDGPRIAAFEAMYAAAELTPERLAAAQTSAP